MKKDTKKSMKHIKITIIITIIMLLIVPVIVKGITNSNTRTYAGGRTWDTIYVEIDGASKDYKVTFSGDDVICYDEGYYEIVNESVNKKIYT